MPPCLSTALKILSGKRFSPTIKAAARPHDQRTWTRRLHGSKKPKGNPLWFMVTDVDGTSVVALLTFIFNTTDKNEYYIPSVYGRLWVQREFQQHRTVEIYCTTGTVYSHRRANALELRLLCVTITSPKHTYQMPWRF